MQLFSLRPKDGLVFVPVDKQVAAYRTQICQNQLLWFSNEIWTSQNIFY